jgi:hypothetical protein
LFEHRRIHGEVEKAFPSHRPAAKPDRLMGGVKTAADAVVPIR